MLFSLISSWLGLPFWSLLGILIAFFGAIATALVLLSFVLPSGPALRRFRGVVAPFIGTVAVIFGILLGFLANDIWDRDARAAAAVRSEAESLLALNALAVTFDLPREPLTGAIRAYAASVVTQEWPRMAQGAGAPATEAALDNLLKTIVRLDVSGANNDGLRRLLLDTGLAVRNARNRRLSLARDDSEDLKWLLVLILAVTSQMTVAVVHLEAIRPQIAALTIWTGSLIIVTGLLAFYDTPFAGHHMIAPIPIAHVLKVVAGTQAPKGGS